MSFTHNGECCAYCKALLFSEDDVVYCPVCGAPHHRECYNALGHCALEQFHGTDKEYSRVKELEKIQQEHEQNTASNPKISHGADAQSIQPDTTRCKICGAEYPFEKSHCPQCGAPNFIRVNGAVFDFYGGVPKETLIDDDITAEEIKKFVISNTQRYIPKFLKLSGGKKASWNWMAFLFPGCWMFSRKMYKGGVIFAVLQLISNLISLPFRLEIAYMGISANAASYAQVFQNFNDAFAEIKPLIIFSLFLSVLIDLAVRIVCGILGDYWYKKYTVASIREIRAESLDAELAYRKKGGVSVFAFLICYLALSYLPAIIVTFI